LCGHWGIGAPRAKLLVHLDNLPHDLNVDRHRHVHGFVIFQIMWTHAALLLLVKIF